MMTEIQTHHKSKLLKLTVGVKGFALGKHIIAYFTLE